jgi:predicted DNA-binding transcriptional regulator AlpA
MTDKQKLAAAFDDLISETELMQKTGYKKPTLAKLRKAGKITYRTLAGRKIMYSKSEIAKQLFNL